MKRHVRALVLVMVPVLLVCTTDASAQDPIRRVLNKLNATRTVDGDKELKSYPVILSAYLEMTPPPIEISTEFNQTTIHPGMDDWSAVSAWAESNGDLRDALLACEQKTLFGLPYGTATLEPKFRDADLVAAIGVGGSLRDNQFRYLDAIETVATFAGAEAYRLLEAGRYDDGLKLAMASVVLLRQCCDREFIDEVLFSVSLLIESLENLRDMLYTYRGKISADQYREISFERLPFLRPDRARLLIPEGDRVVSEALIEEVFDDGGQADRDKFATVFGAVQSEDAPLTRFGAARRWRMIAEVHDSEEASQDRLKLVYDDWFRRWRVEEYDQILDFDTEFERTNPVRYAAVLYSMQDMNKLFLVRNELVAHVNGTAVVAAICAYEATFGTFPSDSGKMYSQFLRKRSDRDPFDLEFLPFKYRLLDERTPVDTAEGRVFLDAGGCILYSKGRDHDDDRGNQHTPDGAAGDLVMFPPLRKVQREVGMVD